MRLWMEWWGWVDALRPACSRKRTFLWMVAVIAAMSVRGDLAGVTSFVRALGLKGSCYERILGLFHSNALDLERLTQLWVALILKRAPGLLRINGRLVLVGDGIKVGKSGRKMPAVKRLHQESESNTKPEFIMGHSIQAVSVLAQGLASVFAIPLSARIHEGVVFNNNDKRTLLDKMVLLLNSLCVEDSYYFVADAYYAAAKIIHGLLAEGNHLITRVKKNAVAFEPVAEAEGAKKRGRPRKYGRKVKLADLFERTQNMVEAKSPVYGEKGVVIQIASYDLLWRNVGLPVRFVVVIHPTRGKILLMCTDLNLSAIEILRIYSLRFKIEVSFKQALYVTGTYAYHFWMKRMEPLKRNAGNQHLHRKDRDYRDRIRRKITAYHLHMQLGAIAQGVLQCLSISVPGLVWSSFGSWIRTIRPGLCPSENTTAIALRNTLPSFLGEAPPDTEFVSFLRDRLDLNRAEGIRLAA
ncbi:MAG: transposase [Candidatus Hydrogenedentes bacterium]|nr:transposase [Candidatus Hydrogenedentota bacterium]